MATIGAAIVGTGFMGRTHAEALRRLEPAVELVGVLGSSPQKSRDFARGIGVESAYSTYDELLADGRVRSIHIATPNRTHLELTRRALEADKHVLCEKPLAMSSRETAELVQLSASRPHLIAGVNYNVRFYPLCIEARERIRSGELGEVFHVTGSYVQDWLLFETDYNWRVLASEGGELRAVADIGTHWLDLVHAVTGLEVLALCADLRTVHASRLRPSGEVETFTGKDAGAHERTAIPITTEDFGSILLRFRGGARGVVHVSQVAAGHKNALRLEVAGSRESLAWSSERPDELWIGRRDRANELLLRDPSLLRGPAAEAADYPGGHNEGYADTFKQSFRAFYRHVEAGGGGQALELATFADGHREVVLCEAVLRSHREGRWIEIEGDS